ncbi:MAG: cytochrome c family protein [Bacteroidetes bacterium]|nr:cytochrome c family protein [Bacteroidota bacterium]
MKKNLIYKIAFILMVSIAILASTDSDTSGEAKTCACGTLIAIEFSDAIPGDNKLVTGQTQADCFAWWEFIALNWPTEAGAEFGAPGDTNPVQWETYMTREVLMTPDGSAPPAWGSNTKAPAHKSDLMEGHPEGTKLLMHSSKFNSDAQILDETGQAAPFNAPNWLGAQNGTNVWYEVLVNKDEYDYIVENEFYNAEKQYDFVSAGNRIDLPSGDASQTGAMELKAAWLEVTDPDNTDKWNRYKLSKAVLVDPATGDTKLSTVALVGLHIIHKTESQPTWFWATFEHVDNVKESEDDQGPWNFYNENCQDQIVEVPANCGQNKDAKAVTVSCDSINVSPPYYLCQGAGPVPQQVSRVIPIDSDAQAVNDQLQAYIKAHFEGSVWQNYQLINMIWSTTPYNNASNKSPQQVRSMQPLIPMANTTAETYVQELTCFNCHQGASIAPVPQDKKPGFASDFSFVFEFANYPGKSSDK